LRPSRGYLPLVPVADNCPLVPQVTPPVSYRSPADHSRQSDVISFCRDVVGNCAAVAEFIVRQIEAWLGERLTVVGYTDQPASATIE